jgi:hypothetical protein
MKGITITISGEPEYKNKISYKGVDCVYEELENGIKIIPLNFCDDIGMGIGASVFINNKNEII